MKIVLIELPQKNYIIDTYARGLKFPDYYRHNWDSFEECLRDSLECRSEEQILVRHSFSYANAGVDRAYLDIVSDAAKTYSNFSIEFNEN